MKLLIVDDEKDLLDHLRMVPPVGEKPKEIQNNTAFINFRDYWVKIYNDRMTVVYQSELTRYADFPIYDKLVFN